MFPEHVVVLVDDFPTLWRNKTHLFTQRGIGHGNGKTRRPNYVHVEMISVTLNIATELLSLSRGKFVVSYSCRNIVYDDFSRNYP